MSADDLPLIRRWLWESHVARWWGNPDEQIELISGDLDHPAMDQFIVRRGARPFAYLQCYDPGAWGNSSLGPHPAGTRGIDQFIGEADMLYCGHGPAFIRFFANGVLKSGTPRVVTDPDPSNTSAIRAYEKAGFRKDRVIDTFEGPALLMVCDA